MERRRRFTAVIIAALVVLGTILFEVAQPQNTSQNQPTITDTVPAEGQAAEVLESLAVKGRAAKTGYSREQFGDGWQKMGACNMREQILRRDLQGAIIASETDCTVQSGQLADVYTGKTLEFKRGPDTSDDVQIDHVVALSDAWQKGAQYLSFEQRLAFANDPLNLMAVEGAVNQAKGDSDAASWLPPNHGFRCAYVARQIAVKAKYVLWVTEAEKATMRQVLGACPGQSLPTR